MNTILKDEDIWALSITITGRCNCNCSYCHFYAKRNRIDYNIDMPEELLDNYIKLISFIKEKYHKNLQIRFSGGEPLVIGNKLFEYSENIYKSTGIKPYVLTNGRLLSDEIISKSKKHKIAAYLVSIENPFDMAEGAPLTNEVLSKIKKYNSKDLPVLPAVMVVKNSEFCHIKKIADYIYKKIHCLPSFSELTYQAFEVPKETELRCLYDNVKSLAKEYYGKTDIRIFPYVSPELYANGMNNYLTELDLENSININNNNINEVVQGLLSKLQSSYRPNPCNNKECDWYDDCRIIKWLWLYNYNSKIISVEDKLNAFCSLKKTINSALYDGISECIGS